MFPCDRLSPLAGDVAPGALIADSWAWESVTTVGCSVLLGAMKLRSLEKTSLVTNREMAAIGISTCGALDPGLLYGIFVLRAHAGLALAIAMGAWP